MTDTEKKPADVLKHTPQWTVNKIVYPRKKDVSFEVLDESGAIICQTIMREVATEQELIAADEKHVKLFAAAPDMLTTLRSIAETLDKMAPCPEEILDQLLAQAQSSIKAAERAA